MSTSDTLTIDRALAQPSLPAAFLEKAAENPGATALRMFGTDEHLTWGDWSHRATAVAGGLQQLGVSRGDRVGLLLGTRMEFHIADMGALLLGAIPFSIYTTSAVVQIDDIVANAEPLVLITEASLVEKARQVAANAPTPLRVVVVEPEAVADGELSLAALEAGCPEGFDLAPILAGTKRDDVCTLIYTSGTTGPPKGVQFRHGALLDCLAMIKKRFGATQADRAISYLPMAHIAERCFGHYAAFVYGYEVTSLADPSQIGAALGAVRPTRFFGVPRIFEKLLAGIQRYAAAADNHDELTAAWDAQRERVRSRQRDEPVPNPESEAADLALLRPLGALVGLEEAYFLAVAGAPSSPEMLEDLTALGLPINEFYGSSETIINTCSPPELIRLGTVGTPFDGIELKLAEDGEILVAGPTVTPGYFRDPERTAEALTEDGWLRTGDIGTFGTDGYLRIIDRKKALIINSGGKNMSPANIEQAIKGGQPLIGQILAAGDRRPYNVAVVVLDRDGAADLAGRHDLEHLSFAELSQHAEIRAAVQAAVDAGNQRLSRIEQIKAFAILDHDWAPGGEELTPTMKLKRREIAARYASVIDDLYAPADGPRA